MRSRALLLALTLSLGIALALPGGPVTPQRPVAPPHFVTEGDPDDLDRPCPSATPGSAAVNTQPGDSAPPAMSGVMNAALQLLTLFGIAR
jgi:hypothetical protein